MAYVGPTHSAADYHLRDWSRGRESQAYCNEHPHRRSMEGGRNAAQRQETGRPAQAPRVVTDGRNGHPRANVNPWAGFARKGGNHSQGFAALSGWLLAGWLACGVLFGAAAVNVGMHWDRVQPP
jgi:hypothetical protein